MDGAAGHVTEAPRPEFRSLPRTERIPLDFGAQIAIRGVGVGVWGWGNSQADADAAGAVNKDYLLPSWAAEVVPRLGPQKRRKNNAYFFDLGASTYDSGLGGISQR